MATFKTDRYPQLQIGGTPKIRFVDGVYETSDPDALAQLRKFAADSGYRITETSPADEPGDQDPPVGGGGEGSGSGPEDVKPPARSASKADWKAYAIAQGVTEDEADKATRDELAARYLDGGGD
ncbi:hypothetical protein AB0D09_02705 [Streptomyces sp. NPDC049097]|uniref:hypothetical protein n=1 Tax=Streptomyces sp. NPDC049097 TaxID=3155497 RepID=UPI003424B059